MTEQQPDETVDAQPNDELQRTAASGASWFYWIAALSLINSAIVLFGGEWSFIVGLGATQIVDVVVAGIAEEMGAGASFGPRALAFGIDMVIAGVFVLFGWFANRRQSWAFIVGMVLYLFDGMLFLLVGDWLSVGFHGFALFCIWSGFAASRALTASAPRAPAMIGNEPITP